ncbi:MAG: cadherin repeat domain-containing protein [Chitinophagaceae bacterium]|nr:cadherin repeat domain-containing protein [Chitinophagaceae bacterium]
METTPSFTLVVKVQDNGTTSLSNQANVTIFVTDVNETASQLPISHSNFGKIPQMGQQLAL